jgi:hypothetical protein
MSTYNPPTIAEMSDPGFTPSGRTKGAEGTSRLEKFRAAADAVYERLFLEASDSSTNPLATTPINPSAFALFGAAGNSGFQICQLDREEVPVAGIAVNDGPGPHLLFVSQLVQAGFPGTHVPMLASYIIDSLSGTYPVSHSAVEGPAFAYRDTPTPGCYLDFSGPTPGSGDQATFEALVYLFKLGSSGSGYTVGAPVATPPFEAISDSEIAADTKAVARLLRKFRNRLDFLWNSINGESDAKKINAQAIPKQSSFSGQGLVGQMFNHRKFSNNGVTLAGNTTAIYWIGQAATIDLGPLGTPVIHTVSGSNYDLKAEPICLPFSGSPYWYVRVKNSGAGSVTFSVDQWMIQLNS